MTFAAHAVGYAERGVAVFPLMPVQKKLYPYSAGFLSDSSDVGPVRRWWTGLERLTPKPYAKVQKPIAILATSNIGFAFARLAMVTNNDSDTSPLFWFTRALTGTGVSVNLVLTYDELLPFFGKYVHVGAWRDATGLYLRMSTMDGVSVVLKQTAAGAVNTNSLANSRIVFGLGGAASVQTYYHRMARGFIENLEITGRSALVVLEDDRKRILARGRIT